MGSKPARLLMLCAYPPAAAATRFRVCGYLDALRSAGIEPEVHPFISDEYFARMYQPTQVTRKALDLAGFALAKLPLLLRSGRYDAVFIQREAALVGPPLLERILVQLRGLPLIYDLDDAVWLEPAPVPGTLRARFPRVISAIRAAAKGDTLLSMATTVVAGSNYLADHARQFCKDVTVLPTVVSREQWRPLLGRLDGAILHDEPLIGWIGTPSTSMYLSMVMPALERLASEGFRFRLRLRGAASSIRSDHFPLENLPWRRDHEAEDFAELDVGLGPIRRDPWADGKSGFKQLQYMAVGVPMVTSMVGGTRDFIEHEGNALVAAREEDWYDHIRTLLSDRPRRASLAQAGRRLVEERYSLEAQGRIFVDCMRKAMR
jgi:glycosyltransferase involved in cell wall biosynthesis